MSDPEREPLGLEAVQTPSSVPSTQADLKTSEEIADASVGHIEYCQPLSSKPAVHRTILSERESKSLHQANELLQGECRDLRIEYNHVVIKYTQLSAHYARLRQAHDSLRGNVGLSTSIVAVGATAVSFAGALTDTTLKPMLLWGGTATFIVGIVVGLWNVFFVRDRHGPSQPDSLK